MTREEQIIEASQLYAKHQQKPFMDGALWADEHPPSLETKEIDLEKEEEKLNKAIKLADAMYNAAQQLTTDASRLHKAMQDWWNFKNIEL